jgi:hypothetical protein
MLKHNAKYLALISMAYLLCSCTQPGTYHTSSNGTDINVSAGGQATYPAQLGIDQFPGSQVTVSASSDNAGSGKSTMVQLSSKEAPPAIAEYYKGKLEGDGWKIDSNMNINGMTMISANKGSEKFAVQIMPDTANNNNGTTIILTKS